jgi:hypothetical protein
MEDQYYLQDKREYVGNDILFWRLGGGYTTNLLEAEVFTKAAAVRHNSNRETDIPWPKEYIDIKTRPAVDMQVVSIAEALVGTGIELRKPAPYVKPRYSCNGCHRFMSEYAYYVSSCDKCGTWNRP